MKLTKRQLRRIIKEEKAKLLKEADHGGGWDGVASSKHGCLSTNEFMHFLAGALQDAGCTLDAESWSYVQSGLDEIESEAIPNGHGRRSIEPSHLIRLFRKFFCKTNRLQVRFIHNQGGYYG